MNTIQASGTTESSLTTTTTALAAAIRLAKPATTFVSRSGDEDLLTITGRILAGLTANAAYPSPTPTLATLTTAFNAFGTAVHANDRGSNAVAARDKARGQLAAVLRELALYVQQASQGDLVTVLSSGYPAQRKRSATALAAPPAPVGVRMRSGSVSGEVFGNCTAVEGAQMYEWQYASHATPTAWTSTGTSTSRRVTVSGLASASIYVFQVRAYGRRGAGNWSENGTIVVA